MSIQVVIPYLSMLWCLEDLLESMGESEIPVLIIDNSPDSDTDRPDPHFTMPKNVTIEKYPENIGVAASWNRGLRQGADQTLIISQMVRFAGADIPRRPERWGLDFVAERIRDNANEFGMTFGDQGYHLISIGRQTVEEIGYFDENYLYWGEDDDYGHRINRAGIVMGGWGEDWDKTSIFSIGFGVQARMGKINFGQKNRMQDYYSHKWCSKEGVYPGDYETPFNNPDVGLNYWPRVQYKDPRLEGSCA